MTENRVLTPEVRLEIVYIRLLIIFLIIQLVAKENFEL